MQVTALKEIRYAGQNHKPGEHFEVSDKDAKILIAIGKVAAYTAPKPKSKKSESIDPIVAPAKPGKYRRRDLRA